MEYKFRDLKAEEIDVRIATVGEKGATLLLYKDARVDMDILDETVGAMNWQRKHLRDNANCVIEIWDDTKKQWIAKEDTGTESFTEKEKGLASDSFKRAGFNWGIGRELYTSPFIFVKSSDYTQVIKNGKPTTYDKFIVSKIEIEDKKITELEITNTKTDRVVYTLYKQAIKKQNNKELIQEVLDTYTEEELAELMKCTASEVKEKLGRQTVATLKSLMRKKIVENKKR